MSTDLTLMGDSPFDAIKRTDSYGEFWSARDLMPLLGYGADWRNFAEAIERAKRSARNVGEDVDVHFVGLTEKSGGRPRGDVHLTRFGSYLIAMNGDSRKQEIAAAQSYFAVKTREAETAKPVVVAEISRRELAAMVIAEADRADAAEARAKELAPAANSWAQLAEAKGDYSLREAAQILDRDPSIRTGQNRLAKWLRNFAWTDHNGQPYQRQVEMGRLVVRSRSFVHPSTGDETATTQVRVTVRGLQVLHREMGGSGPLLMEVSA
jgi:DNA-damage-inducible protein D